VPPLIFAHELVLDGSPYKSRRVGAGDRGVAVDFIPQQAAQQATVQLTPANATTWHRGSGASLPMLPGMHAWSKNGDTCNPGLVLPGPLVTTVTLPNSDGDVASFAEQDGELYVFAGRYVTRIPTGSGAAVAERDLGAGFQTTIGGVRRFNGNLYVGGLATGFLWEKVSGGGAWNQSTDAQRGAMRSVFWTLGGVTSERLVGQVGASGIKYVAYGADAKVNANWAPGTAIDVGYPITSLVATRDHIYIGTTGGLKDLDSSGLAPNLTPEAEVQVFATNGVATLAADGWIYYGLGYGLKRVRVANATSYAEIEDVTPPGNVLPNETPVGGLPTAIARYGNWIILAQWDQSAQTGGTTYISWGRDAVGGEVGPMVWNCSPIVLDGLKVTRLHVSGLVAGNPRLWCGVVDASGNRSLRWAPLPLQTPYQDLRNGRAYRFAPTWDLYESYIDFGDDSLPKVIPDLVAESEGLGAGASLAVSAAVDGSSSYDQLGVLNASPRTTLTPLVEVKALRIQLKYSGSGTSLAPPVLRKRALRALGRPDLREIRTYQLVIGSAVRHPGGNVAGTNTLQQKTALSRLQVGSSVTMRDEDGLALRVMVASGIHFAEAEMDVAGRGERVLAATIQVAVLSTPGTGFRWNDGTRWNDSGRVWG
jgi:hypothetical protein